MKLLINKEAKGAKELQQLTGSYYKSNEFTRIRTDWVLAQEAIQKLVSKEVMTRALQHYHSEEYENPYDFNGSGDNLDNELVNHLQMAIAYRCTYNYYQTNITSHEDAGRKVKIDPENEKLPWEWMLDRDDRAQIKRINQTSDRLVDFLEDNKINEWFESTQRKASRNLFVNTPELFHEAYPIDMSTRFFYSTTAFNAEIQNKHIRKALGAEYQNLLDYFQAFAGTDYPYGAEGSGSASGGLPGEVEVNEYYEDLLQQVQKVIPMLTMDIAYKRLSLQALPDGVVQKFNSQFQSRSSSQPVMIDVIAKHCRLLREDADRYLDDIKRIIHANDPEATDHLLLPNNEESNKFFRT